MKAVSCISPPGFEAQYLATLRDALDRDGFVVVPAALNDEWVARLHRAFEVAPVPPSGTQHVTITDTTPEVESWRALERHPLFSAGAHHVLGLRIGSLRSTAEIRCRGSASKDCMQMICRVRRASRTPSSRRYGCSTISRRKMAPRASYRVRI